MPEFVRVRDKDTKHEYSVVASAVDPAAHEVLKSKDAVHVDGTPLPMKPHVSLSSKEPSGQKADSEKEKS